MAWCNSLSWHVPCSTGHNNLICSQIQCMKLFFFFFFFGATAPCVISLADDYTPHITLRTLHSTHYTPHIKLHTLHSTYPYLLLFRTCFHSQDLSFFDTESSHLNLGLPFFLLISGRDNFIFIQGTFSSILAICPSHFYLDISLFLLCLYKQYSS
jgi:hypothetical protein